MIEIRRSSRSGIGGSSPFISDNWRVATDD